MRALLAVVPRLTAAQKRAGLLVQGAPPSAARLPAGPVSSNPCPSVKPACTVAEPALTSSHLPALAGASFQRSRRVPLRLVKPARAILRSSVGVRLDRSCRRSRKPLPGPVSKNYDSQTQGRGLVPGSPPSQRPNPHTLPTTIPSAAHLGIPPYTQLIKAFMRSLLSAIATEGKKAVGSVVQQNFVAP